MAKHHRTESSSPEYRLPKRSRVAPVLSRPSCLRCVKLLIKVENFAYICNPQAHSKCDYCSGVKKTCLDVSNCHLAGNSLSLHHQGASGLRGGCELALRTSGQGSRSRRQVRNRKGPEQQEGGQAAPVFVGSLSPAARSPSPEMFESPVPGQEGEPDNDEDDDASSFERFGSENGSGDEAEVENED